MVNALTWVQDLCNIPHPKNIHQEALLRQFNKTKDYHQPQILPCMIADSDLGNQSNAGVKPH